MGLEHAIQEVVDSNLKSQVKVKSALKSAGLEPRVLTKIAPQDDGSDPNAPQNLTLTPGLKLLNISWEAPTARDAVDKAEVEITPEGGTTYTVVTSGFGYVIEDAEYVPYSVRVRFIDLFDRYSVWSNTVTASPMETAEYGIDLVKASLLETIQGQLPEANIATLTDAAKLGDGIVLARTMAAQNTVALNSWIETAAIDNALIKDLKVDKLTGGEINTNTITVKSTLQILSGGSLLSGGATLNDGGVGLNEVSSHVQFPDSGSASKLTPAGSNKFAGLSFFRTQSNPWYQGMALNADGSTGTVRKGLIRLCATDGNQNNSSIRTAIIAVESGDDNSVNGKIHMKGIIYAEEVEFSGHIRGYNHIAISGNVAAGGRYVPQADLTSSTAIAGNGSAYTFTHSKGILTICKTYYSFNGSVWRETDGLNGIDTTQTANAISIVNNSGTSYFLRIVVYG